MGWDRTGVLEEEKDLRRFTHLVGFDAGGAHILPTNSGRTKNFNFLQIGRKPPVGFAVRVTDRLSRRHTFAAHVTSISHNTLPGIFLQRKILPYSL